MGKITTQAVGKFYGSVEALRNIDITVEDGEFLVLVGPSGCGKSTLLRMIAGLEDISSGLMKINEDVVNHLEPQERDVAMVFQNYALYPHMTVAENISFSMRLKGVPKKECRKLVEEVAKSLELTDLLDRKPKALSGGQRQRVAMGRAIIRQPAVFLMDEPLSNLDAKLRVQMRSEIRELHARLKITTVYVTHDQTEALTLGSRVAVMRPLSKNMHTNIQQIAPPTELFNKPNSIFVAGFIGSPAMNMLWGEISVNQKNVVVDIGAGSVKLPIELAQSYKGFVGSESKHVVVGFRPSSIAICNDDDDEDAIDVLVDDVELLGEEVSIHFTINAIQILPDEMPEKGFTVESVAKSEQAHLIARLPATKAPSKGDRIKIEIDIDHMHLFNPITGEAYIKR